MIELNWQIPKLEEGQEIRFLYYQSNMVDYRGYRGVVINKRHLAHEPVVHKNLDIKRGSMSITITYWANVCENGEYVRKKQYRTFYNQRMANVEIMKCNSKNGKNKSKINSKAKENKGVASSS